MGNRTEKTRKYWRGIQENWDGISVPKSFPPIICTYSRFGNDNPKYKQLIKDGGDATNYLLTTNQTVHFKKGKLKAIYKNKLSSSYGKIIKTDFFDNFSPQPITLRPGMLFRSSVDNAALIGIIKKIRKYETNDFAGPTFTGELRETIKMIKSPLAALRLKTGLFTDLHMRILRDKQAKGKKFKPDPWLKVLSDTYLEWIFGAAPLINDIASIADNYLEYKARHFPDGVKRLSYRFSDSYSNVTAGDQNFGWTGTSCQVPFTNVDHYRCSVQYVVGIDNRLAFVDEALHNLKRYAKFDWDEIIPTAWELMPWSFLIDYFTNIGDVLGSTFNFNRNVRWAKKTTFETATRFHVPGVPFAGSPASELPFEFEPWEYLSQYTRVERQSVARLGFPQLDVSLPSIGQASNILALFRSLQRSNPFRGHILQ